MNSYIEIEVLMPSRAFCFLNEKLDPVLSELSEKVLMPSRAFCFLNEISHKEKDYTFNLGLNALSGILYFKPNCIIAIWKIAN